MISIGCEYNTKSRFDNISRTSWNWDFTKSMSSGEEEREEVIRRSGSDRGSVGDDSLTCMTNYLWNSVLKASFKNFMWMFDELLTRVMITKHNTNYRGPRPWSETCPHSAASRFWDQVSLNVLWVEGASRYHIPSHPKSVPGHHR